MSESSPNSEEQPREITNEKQLVRALGFERYEEDGKRWLQRYTKPIDTGQNTGFAILSGQVMRNPSGKRYEIGAKLKRGRTIWQKDLGFLGTVPKNWEKETTSKMEELQRIPKTYQEIAQLVEQAEDEKKFSEAIDKLSRSYKTARSLALRVQTHIQERYPEFSVSADYFDSQGEIFLVSNNPAQGKKYPPAIVIIANANHIRYRIGTARPGKSQGQYELYLKDSLPELPVETSNGEEVMKPPRTNWELSDKESQQDTSLQEMFETLAMLRENESF